MELYEIKEKVGSDPCLVLDFDAKVTLSDITLTISTNIGVFETEAAAAEFIDAFSKMIEDECKTKQVVFKSHIVEADSGCEELVDSVIINNNIVFATWNNIRTLFLYTPIKVPNVGIKIVETGIVISPGPEGITVMLKANIPLTQ